MTTLEDLRILDLSSGVAGAYCTKLFADLGADVIVIEPPLGNALRHSELGPELGTSKRAVTLDLQTATGRRILGTMVEQANVVVETGARGDLDAIGLGYAKLQGIKRRIILVSIPPVEGAHLQAQLLAGLHAFTAAAVAAHNADAYEVPQHIEISAEQCMATAAAAGEVRALSLDSVLFEMSEVERDALPAPGLGEHNVEFLGEELGMSPRDMVRLRAAGVI